MYLYFWINNNVGIILAQNILREKSLFVQNWREIMNFLWEILAKSLAK